MPSSVAMQEKSRIAAKWSLLTEVAVKIISPISQLILARLLAPEAFGMVATVTMVVNFAEMFSDAGFQKYLVQHEFVDKRSLYDNANVAFWTNFGVSIALWLCIALFNEQVAAFVGNPSLGIPLMVACLTLPLSSFSSIQMALFHRAFDFKSLMPVRLASSILTFVTTLTLAFLGCSYWSLIIGTLVGNAVNAIALTIKSSWRPKLFYSFALLKEMFSFSSWTLLESFTVWLSVWSGTFIVGNILGPGDLGLYKTPITFVSGCFAIVTNATTPILFSSLSRLQLDKDEYLAYFYRFQYVIGLVLLPLSVGIFVFRDSLVLLLLGDQWTESALMFGLYGLLQGPMVLFSYYSSEMYRSLGKPRVSTVVQVIFMVLMVPIMAFAAFEGFDAVVLADAATRLMLIAINQIMTFFVVGISFASMLKSLKEPILATAAMTVFAVLTYESASQVWWGIALDIVGCISVYFIVCALLPKSRKLLIGIIQGGFKKSLSE